MGENGLFLGQSRTEKNVIVDVKPKYNIQQNYRQKLMITVRNSRYDCVESKLSKGKDYIFLVSQIWLFLDD